MDEFSSLSYIEKAVSWVDTNKSWFLSGIGLVIVPFLWQQFKNLPRIYTIGREILRRTFRRFSPKRSDCTLPRKIVCALQGDYALFSFMAEDLHAELECQLRRDDISRINEARKSLSDFVESGISNASHTAFYHLKTHFERRRQRPPRFCVKSVRELADHTKVTYTQWRYSDLPRQKKYKDDYPISAHSIFRDMEREKTAKGIVINNIPKAAGHVPDGVERPMYESARLDPDKAKRYWAVRQNQKQCKIYNSSPDLEWMRCWIAENPGAPGGLLTIDDEDEPSCYKSALVVPITLRGNTLENDALSRLKAKLESTGKGEVERYIFGFVCIDHVECDFFDSNPWGMDVNLCYIVADLISLYMLKRFFLIETSDTFLRATNNTKEHVA